MFQEGIVQGVTVRFPVLHDTASRYTNCQMYIPGGPGRPAFPLSPFSPTRAARPGSPFTPGLPSIPGRPVTQHVTRQHHQRITTTTVTIHQSSLYFAK